MSLSISEGLLSMAFSISISLYLLVTAIPALDIPSNDYGIVFMLIFLFTTPVWLMVFWTMEQIKK